VGDARGKSDGVAFIDHHVFAVNGEAEAAAFHIGALHVGVGMHGSDAAFFKTDLHHHDFRGIGQHLAADTASQIL
jgi:hypothetical protein